MSDAIWAAIIGVAGTFGGIAFGLWWNRNATKKAVDLAFPKMVDLLVKHEIVKAASDFKNTFLDTKYRLWSTIHDQPVKRWKTIDAVEADYLIHERAYFKFREFLTTKDERFALDDAWNEYICKPHEDDDLQDLFRDYFPIENKPGFNRTEEECNVLACDRLDKLISLAK